MTFATERLVTNRLFHIIGIMNLERTIATQSQKPKDILERSGDILRLSIYPCRRLFVEPGAIDSNSLIIPLKTNSCDFFPSVSVIQLGSLSLQKQTSLVSIMISCGCGDVMTYSAIVQSER